MIARMLVKEIENYGLFRLSPEGHEFMAKSKNIYADEGPGI
jgi:hypothetical protein